MGCEEKGERWRKAQCQLWLRYRSDEGIYVLFGVSSIGSAETIAPLLGFACWSRGRSFPPSASGLCMRLLCGVGAGERY